jgi:alginate O-acetyltransferase complex protein AlgI
VLFNSFAFFLVFLPVALTGYFVLSRYSIRLSITFLLLASIIFYGYWSLSYIPLLLGSIAANYFLGQSISRDKQRGNEAGSRRFLVIGLIFNLSLLGFFKYLDFFVVNAGLLTGIDWKPPGIALPIGISFFTFTQIAYLVDCRRAEIYEYKVENYGLFVTYFPHLIAGPILHHKEMMPQFERISSHVFSFDRINIGLLFFVTGLFKKVILADGVAQFVAPVFDLHHARLTVLESWIGVLAYTFQLYFDFSAYCDMAYGLSYMFGIILPINFNSPYKARSIIDFWRRWHITLSTFLKDYLYIPLGGNRNGSARRHLNLFATMVLGGLWHGANWTFIVWGALHGLYLIVNHMLNRLLPAKTNAISGFFGAALTFGAVVLAWVFFRSSSLSVANNLLDAMFFGTFAPAQGNLAGLNRIMDMRAGVLWILTCGAVAFCLPNIYEIVERGAARWRSQIARSKSGRLIVLGSAVFGLQLTLILFLLAIAETRGVSEFLYFNF